MSTRSAVALALIGGVLLIVVLRFTSGGPSQRASTTDAATPGDTLQTCEVAPQLVSLGAPLNQDSIEISGLAWHGDLLVVLPQYPSRAAPEGTRRLYGLPRDALSRTLADSAAAPLAPVPIQFEMDGSSDDAATYQGFEALTFADRRAYLLMERARSDGGMDGLLFPGTVSSDRQRVAIRSPEAQTLTAQAVLRNMSYEALTTVGDTVLALFEANGARVNPRPRAYQFDAAGRPLGSVPFPTLEYRLTDATSVDADGQFWVMNYFYPGERGILQPAADSLAMRFGEGRTHRAAEVVERLVEYRYTPTGIRRTDTPPILLALDGETGRNWEGLARFADGFLLATDRFPSTLLAYVPSPHAASCRETMP